MSDSSEDEDLSRFRDAVDTTFTKLINESRGKSSIEQNEKQRSERYLDVATHYNDIKVSEKMQKRIGAKISAIINSNIEFIDVQNQDVKKRKVKGGVKLFRDSIDFMPHDETPAKDIVTELHNRVSKKLKLERKRRHIDHDVKELNEEDKINMVVVSADSLLSTKEKRWTKKRKQNVSEYRAVGNNKSNLIIGVM